MSYEWVDHTSELELRVDASTPTEVFADAARALGELVSQRYKRPADPVELELEAPDGASLLAAWLEELVYLADSEGFVAEEIELVALRRRRLRARVSGYVGETRPLVKAVTYHRLSLEEQNGRWTATVVLDV